MKLYPAIDLKDGKCVRLFKGDMAAATIYNEDASAQARRFEAAGFEYLHVVDLNGAVSGKAVNRDVVARILAAVTMPVQLGGGIRDRASVESWLEAGVSRVILGTAAVKNAALVKEIAKAYPNKIVVGIDARNGMVAVEGWVKASTMKALDLAKSFEDAGVAAIIYTDIARDGTLDGPNLEETVALAEAISIPVILSGGIGSMDDLRAAKAYAKSGIEGIIIGRALYENTIQPYDALALMQG
ncbi:MAG: 1-(5-phosphoribosyl)-5-[(5-phosphoribosylamino)methylideneamino]imidazole-4-carboxamide isomerase [Rickettsiales bacterium]|nr:1-(5-phosphoribosyl)-5-[(5-phosphoribosylamino)methylideneamino]imidazole-4-carboxamide isomerase [Rickettsiales bacterium]